jgi:hypothetical protein
MVMPQLPLSDHCQIRIYQKKKSDEPRLHLKPELYPLPPTYRGGEKLAMLNSRQH